MAEPGWPERLSLVGLAVSKISLLDHCPFLGLLPSQLRALLQQTLDI